MNLCYAALQCYASASLSSHHGSAPLQPNEQDMAWRHEAQSTSKGRLHQFDAFTVATTHGPRQVDWWPGLRRGCITARKCVANVMCSWAMHGNVMMWGKRASFSGGESMYHALPMSWFLAMMADSYIFSFHVWCWYPSKHSIQIERGALTQGALTNGEY